MPDLRQAAGAAVQAVLFQALRRCRSQPLAQGRLCRAGDRERRRGRRQDRGRAWRAVVAVTSVATSAVSALPLKGGGKGARRTANSISDGLALSFDRTAPRERPRFGRMPMLDRRRFVTLSSASALAAALGPRAGHAPGQNF